MDNVREKYEKILERYVKKIDIKIHQCNDRYKRYERSLIRQQN